MSAFDPKRTAARISCCRSEVAAALSGCSIEPLRCTLSRAGGYEAAGISRALGGTAATWPLAARALRRLLRPDVGAARNLGPVTDLDADPLAEFVRIALLDLDALLGEARGNLWIAQRAIHLGI